MSPTPGQSRLRLNAAISIVGRAASMLLWIVATPYVLERLGQERFAVWSLFFLLNGYVISLDLGSWAAASRFVAVAVARQNRGEAATVVAKTLLLGLGIGLMWGLLGVLGRGFFIDVFNVPAAWAGEVRAGLVLFSASLVLFAVSQSLLGALVGFQRMDLWNLYFLAGLVTHLGALVILLARGQGLVGTAAAAVAGHSLTALLAYRSVRAELARLPVSEEPARFQWRDLLGYGFIVQGANFFGTAQFQAGKVLLGVVGKLAWVTQFELAFRVTNALWSLSTLIQISVGPASAHAYETEGLAGARRLYDWCCRWVLLIGAYVLGLVGATAPALFTLWLGKPHPEVAVAARWIAAGLGFSTLAGPACTVARALGLPWLEALNFGVALAVNVVFGVILIPRIGIHGAGIAMTVSFMIATTVLLGLFHRRVEVSNGAWLARIALPRLLPAVVAALGIGLLGDRWVVDTRGEAFLATAAEGLAFTLIFLASTWPTGDARSALERASGRLARFRAGKVDREP